VYPPTHTRLRVPLAGFGLLSEWEYLFDRGRLRSLTDTLARSSFHDRLLERVIGASLKGTETREE
jgi:hypothetical protein